MHEAASIITTPFCLSSPDLNWRNPEVREAMHEALRFWLQRGADGFRVDVIWHLIKDKDFRDNRRNPAWTPKDLDIERLVQVYSADQPEVHGVIAGLRRVVDEFEDRVLIGEIYLPLERLVAYYGENLSGAHLPFNFHLLQTPWGASEIAKLIKDYEVALPDGGWPNWVLSNHDRAAHRRAGRAGASPRRRHAAFDVARGAQRFITATSLASAMSKFLRAAYAIRGRCVSRASASGATVRARRCSGTPASMPVSRRTSRGCR